jgi:hypothetical protein
VSRWSPSEEARTHQTRHSCTGSRTNHLRTRNVRQQLPLRACGIKQMLYGPCSALLGPSHGKQACRYSRKDWLAFSVRVACLHNDHGPRRSHVELRLKLPSELKKAFPDQQLAGVSMCYNGGCQGASLCLCMGLAPYGACAV